MDNTIPSLERAIALMELLEGVPHGITAADLAAATLIPRTTLFRILRILTAHGFVSTRQEKEGRYVLGPTIARMSAGLTVSDKLIPVAVPKMDSLCARLGETVKLVSRDDLETVALAVSHPRLDSRIASRIGSRLPMHIGAAQRLLLAHAPKNVIESVLRAPLAKWASESITSIRALRASIEDLRGKSSAMGGSEGNEGVGTVAAVIHEPGRPVRAALSVLFVLSGKNTREMNLMRKAVVATAEEISSALLD